MPDLSNNPPLDTAERIPERLDLEHAELLDRVADLEMQGLMLPEQPATDEEAAAIADHVVERRRLVKDLGEMRLETSKPYRDGASAVNDWFNGLSTPAEAAMKDLTRRVGVYNESKAARLRAEQEARRREEEAKARAAREEADKKAKEAAEAQRLADEAKAQMQSAHDDAARKAAETTMRQHLQQADAAQQDAEVLETRAEMAEDVQATLERAATRPVAGTGGARSASHAVTAWAFSVTGHTELLASLGPLGKYFGADAINGAIRAAIREGVRDGIPGVLIEPEDRTVIRQSKARS